MTKEMSDIISLYPWRWNGFYVTAFNRIRLWFTRFDLIEEQIPKKGKIVDIGCGYGIFANFLALRSRDRMLVGLDKNPRKVKYAFRGLKNTQFISIDINDYDFKACQAITIIDVLHHLASFREQEDLLQYCYENLEKGGVLFIKDVCFEPYSKFFLTRIVDNMLYIGDRFYFRKWEEFRDVLEKIGFEVVYVPLHKGTPYSTFGLLCTKM
jgi:SAM-dependent methyltransferase